jgi:hypothetical protein
VPTCSIAPWFMTTMRSATESASSWSCVTMIVVTPSFCWSERISWRSRTRSRASSAESGSSRRSRPGAVASARARAMPLLLAARELGRELGAAARQADQLQQLVDARRDARLGVAPVDEAVADVVGDREVRNSAYDWKTMP